jgi:hypothetical protein
MMIYLQNIPILLLTFAYLFFPVFLTAAKKKAKKMAFIKKTIDKKIAQETKSVYSLSATGYHFTGPLALRP